MQTSSFRVLQMGGLKPSARRKPQRRSIKHLCTPSSIGLGSQSSSAMGAMPEELWTTKGSGYITAPSSAPAVTQSSDSSFQDAQTAFYSRVSSDSLHRGEHGDIHEVSETSLGLGGYGRLGLEGFGELAGRQNGDAATTGFEHGELLHLRPGPISDSSQLAFVNSEDTAPVSCWRRKKLRNVTRGFASKFEKFLRRASNSIQTASPQKLKPLVFHNSWKCNTYQQGHTTEKSGFLRNFSTNPRLPTWLILATSGYQEKWLNSWHPSLSRIWRSTWFWIIEIGSYILVAPILIPWEVCAIIGILFVRIWKGAKRIRRDRVLTKLRDNMEWVTRGGVVGVMLGTCMAFTARQYWHR